MTRWLPDPDAFAAYLAESGPVIGFDTEFHRVDSYWPELALTQFSGASGVALVDPQAWPLDAPLAALVEDPSRTKLMHSASEDLIVLGRIGARRVAGLFDTQIAAAYAGLGHGLGYRALVQALTGVVVPKDETRSDWRRRPLSASQVAYAEADVEHLLPIHAQLVDTLERRGMLDWCLEDCVRLAATVEATLTPDPEPHLAFNTAARLGHAAQRRLRRILLERERLAREHNRPLRWILDDATAFALAERPPPSTDAVLELCAKQRSFPKRERQAFAEWLLDEPAPDAGDGFRPAPQPLDNPQRNRVDRLRDRIQQRAESLDLPPPLLAPRRLLEGWVRGETVPELAGWRGPVLAEILSQD